MKAANKILRYCLFLLFIVGFPGLFEGAAAQYVTVQNGNFYRGGQPWFPYGVNYWPLYAIQFPYSYPEYWLGSGYRPKVVEADLTVLASMGVNCISSQGSLLVEQAPANLIDFLTRCRNHNLQVILSFSKADPMNPVAHDGPTYGSPPTRTYIDPETALDRIIPSLQLDQRPEILSYDIAWEPHLGTWDQGRAAWDGVWSRFIAREFGSVAAANLAFQPHQLVTQYSGSLASGLLSLTMPVRALADKTVSCKIVMQNLGNTWHQGQVVLLPLFGEGLPGTSNPIGLQEASVTTGNQGTFSFSYNAANPGRNRLRLTLASLGKDNAYYPFGTLVEWEVEVVFSGRAVVRTIDAPPPILGCPGDNELDPVFPPTDPRFIPSEPPLPAAPPSAAQNFLVNAYRRCLDTETATRFGRVIRRIRQLDPNHLISCRQGWDGNGNPFAVTNYPLEMVATAYHFDFQGVENYYLSKTTTPLSDGDYILAGMATDQAYSRWATGGKPVIWAEAGYLYAAPSFNPPIAPRPQTQADYYSQFITSMLATNGNGVQFWWWPGGLRTTQTGELEDWGITNPDGTLRQAAAVMADLASKATSPRSIPQHTVTGTPVDLLADARGYAWIYCTHQKEALAAIKAPRGGKNYVLIGKGADKDSSSTTWVGGLPEFLWAEISKVELKVGETGSWFEVRDGMAYAVPAGKKIYCRAEVINMGDATWLTNVAFAANPREAGFLNFAPQHLTANAPRLTKVTIPEFQLSSGLGTDQPVQFQMNAQGVCWITGSMQVLLAVDKSPLTGLNLLLLD
ncbi:MAG: hypothetical protein AB1424_18570 [Thermodesulfobacteriota bacterium]